MNKQNKEKIATISCIVVSILFSVLLGVVIHFKLSRIIEKTYKETLQYSENTYREYQEEAEKMLVQQEYTSDKYPVNVTFESDDSGRCTMIMKIGEYAERWEYSDYLTVTVENFGTKKQTVRFERSRKNMEAAHKEAEEYKIRMKRLFIVGVLLWIAFIGFLIISSILKKYSTVIGSNLLIAGVIALIYFIPRLASWLFV